MNRASKLDQLRTIVGKVEQKAHMPANDPDVRELKTIVDAKIAKLQNRTKRASTQRRVNDSNIRLSDKVARIARLKHYISLLEREQKRLKWLNSSTVASKAERAEAQTKIGAIAERLRSAELELINAELKKKTN